MAKNVLKCRSLFGGNTLVVDDDALVVLEADLASDRMRRLLYNRIESITTWRRIPWTGCIVGALLGLAGLVVAIMGARDSFMSTEIIGLVVLAGGLLVLGKYAWYKRTHIAVTRDGQTKRFSGIISPAVRRRFFQRLDAAVRGYQQAHHPAPPGADQRGEEPLGEEPPPAEPAAPSQP